MSERKRLRNAGAIVALTPDGTVSASKSCSILTKGIILTTSPTAYNVDPEELCHKTKEHLRTLFCLDKLPNIKRRCIESIMQKMILPANEHIFLDATSLPHLYLASLISKTPRELNEELNNKNRLLAFREQQEHTKNARSSKDDAISGLVSFLKEKFFDKNPCDDTKKAEIEKNFYDVVGVCISVISGYLGRNPSNMRITDPVSLVSGALKNEEIKHKDKANFVAKIIEKDSHYANIVCSSIFKAAKLKRFIECRDELAREQVALVNRTIRERPY